MKRMLRLLPALLLIWTFSGCTNYLYQGNFSGLDAYDKEGRFLLYWTKTEKSIGSTKAGPAILMTECSPTRISFDDQPEGIIFRGEQGRDRLPEKTSTADGSQVCGRILNYARLADAHEGELSITINCEPMPQGEFDALPRNYPKAKPDPYIIPVIEKTRHWSLFGETLEAPNIGCAK